LTQLRRVFVVKEP